MINKVKDALKRQLLVTTEKLIAKAYVRQCQRLADGDDMKLADYLRPSTEPICLWHSVEKLNDKGHVELGDFVVVVNEHQEHWVLTFDDYVHANEMAELYTQMTKQPVQIHPTSAVCVFTQEAPVMGASCCKTDGIVIETPSSVYRALYKAQHIRNKLRQARKVELEKREEAK
jgi:hypothetical protein